MFSGTGLLPSPTNVRSVTRRSRCRSRFWTSIRITRLTLLDRVELHLAVGRFGHAQVDEARRQVAVRFTLQVARAGRVVHPHARSSRRPPRWCHRRSGTRDPGKSVGGSGSSLTRKSYCVSSPGRPTMWISSWMLTLSMRDVFCRRWSTCSKVAE